MSEEIKMPGATEILTEAIRERYPEYASFTDQELIAKYRCSEHIAKLDWHLAAIEEILSTIGMDNV